MHRIGAASSLAVALALVIASETSQPVAQIVFGSSVVFAQEEEPSFRSAPGVQYKPGEVIIKYKPTASQSRIQSLMTQAGLRVTKTIGDLGLYVSSIETDVSVEEMVQTCNSWPEVEYAEPNYIYYALETPNDPDFSKLYGMRQIQAPEAWDLQTGSQTIVVGVIDTGVDYNHEDLQTNMWRNPGESGDGKENNGIDDDGNGYVDDYRGWNFIFDNGDPRDDNNHGSHVAGTLGAVGNNGRGVVGVNWRVSIMPLKFLNREGSGELDDAVEAILYAAKMGARVTNNSWGGGGFSKAMEDAIKFANERGMLFVAAAGNASNNNDDTPSYPASYQLPNVISVAANDDNDRLAGFSNYGRRTVHLSAPGVSILSSTRGNLYRYLSGTSMATPHVAGAAALVWAQYPSLTAQQVKIRLLGSVDRRSEYTDNVSTGGRLNVFRALSTDPIVANTTQLDNTPDTAGPYVVEAQAVDDGGLAQVSLVYQVNGGEADTLVMAPSGEDTYRAEIPGQAMGSQIVYFVTARDNEGNMGRGRILVFRIEEPGGGGLCGQWAIALNMTNPAVRRAVELPLNLVIFLTPYIVWRRRRPRNQTLT
jgi:subtilisin family serine protease